MSTAKAPAAPSNRICEKLSTTLLFVKALHMHIIFIFGYNEGTISLCIFFYLFSEFLKSFENHKLHRAYDFKVAKKLCGF